VNSSDVGAGQHAHQSGTESSHWLSAESSFERVVCACSFPVTSFSAFFLLVDN
jgi:hypothetical protein